MISDNTRLAFNIGIYILLISFLAIWLWEIYHSRRLSGETNASPIKIFWRVSPPMLVLKYLKSDSFFDKIKAILLILAMIFIVLIFYSVFAPSGGH